MSNNNNQRLARCNNCVYRGEREIAEFGFKQSGNILNTPKCPLSILGTPYEGPCECYMHDKPIPSKPIHDPFREICAVNLKILEAHLIAHDVYFNVANNPHIKSFHDLRGYTYEWPEEETFYFLATKHFHPVIIHSKGGCQNPRGFLIAGYITKTELDATYECPICQERLKLTFRREV